MRLIDADALKETIASNVYPVADYFNSRDYGMFWTGGIEKAIDEQPTIEPEHKTGRWIEDHKLFGKGPTAFKCSVCGTIGFDCDDYKFCHMCGADMRGETDG